MATFNIKSFRGGKSDYEDRGIYGAYLASKNLNIHGLADCLVCNQALITDGNANAIVTDLINFWVNSSDGNTYGFGDTGKIYKRTSGAVWSLVYTDADGEIKGAYEWYCDNGNKYMFWATNTKLHAKLIPGASNWSDVDATITPLSGTPQTYPKTNLTAATWHTMTQANGALMICNDKLMAMVGYDGSYTNEALMLRPGIISQAVIEKGNQVLIGGGDGVRESWLSTWEQTALSWLDKNRIPAKSINAIVQAELMLMSAGDNEMYYSDMVNNLEVCALDGKANPGGVVEQGGLALFGLFGGSFSGIWSYGRTRKNESYTLNLEQYLDADEIGAICKIAGQVFVSYQKGATHAVRKVDPSTKAVAEYYSLDLVAPKESAWNTIELVSETVPTGCSIALYYDLNKTGVWTQAYMAGDIATSTAGDRNPVFMCGSYGQILNLKIVLTPSGNTSPNINSILINLE
jgi:hypothetical protein